MKTQQKTIAKRIFFLLTILFFFSFIPFVFSFDEQTMISCGGGDSQTIILCSSGDTQLNNPIPSVSAISGSVGGGVPSRYQNEIGGKPYVLLFGINLHYVLLIIFGISILLFLLILFFVKRRKEENKNRKV